MATCGIAAGARPVLQRLTEEVAKRGLKNVTVAQTGCIGICQYEPVVEVFENGKEKVTYVKMTEDKIAQVVAEHLVNGQSHCGIHHRRGAGRSQGLIGGTAKRCIVHMYWCAEAPAVPPPAVTYCTGTGKQHQERRAGAGGQGHPDRMLWSVCPGPHYDYLSRRRVLLPGEC